MADNTLEVQFSLTGLAAVLKGFKQVQAAAKSAGVPTGGASTAGVTGGSTFAGASAFRASSAMMRQQALQASLASKMTFQNSQQNARLQNQQLRNQKAALALQQAQNRAAKAAQIPSFFKKFETFVRSTRFGAAGVQPLVGRTLDLVGEGGPAGIGLAFLGTAAFEAGKMLKEFGDRASDNIQAFSKLQAYTGGTAKETAKLSGLATFLKVDPGSLSGTAQNLAAAATGQSGPFAFQEAYKAGLSPTPFPFAHKDQAADVFKTVDYLRSIKSDQAASVAARNLNAPELLPLRQLKDSDYQDLVKKSEASAGVLGDNKASTEYLKSQTLNTQAINNLTTTIGRVWLPRLTRWANAATTEINKDTSVYNKRGFWAALLDPKGMIANAPANYAAAHAGSANIGGMDFKQSPPITAASVNAAASSPSGKAQDAHTKALEKHSNALNKNSSLIGLPGTYGNATRGDAFQQGQTGFSLHKALADKEGFQLGAF